MPDNNSPINQVAKRVLLQLKLKPDQRELYLVQLLEWWRKKTGRPKPESPAAEMWEMWDRLMARSPREIMRVFEENQADKGEPSGLLELCTQGKPISAPNLAQEAWEQLDSWMSVNGLFADSPHPEQAGL
jgi:hypothetical protein